MSIMSSVPSVTELFHEATTLCEAGFLDQKDRFIKYAGGLTRLRLIEKGIYVVQRDHEADELARAREHGEIVQQEMVVAERIGAIRICVVSAYIAAARLLAMFALLATDVAVMVLVCGDYLGIDTQRGLFAEPLRGFIALSLGAGLTFVTVLLAELSLGAWENTPPYGVANHSRIRRLLPAAALLGLGVSLAALRTDATAGSWFFSLLGVLALPVSVAALQQKFGIGKPDAQQLRAWLSTRADRKALQTEARNLSNDRKAVVHQREAVRQAATDAARGQAAIDQVMAIVQTRAEIAFERAAADLRHRRQEPRVEPQATGRAPWTRRFGVS